MSNIPSIAILPTSDFTLNAFGSFLDVLRLAADEGDRSRPERLRWTIVAPSMAPVRASCGVTIQPWEELGDPARFDYLVVCGGLLRRPPSDSDAIHAYLARAAAAGVTLVSLCTGAFILARAGLLNGHRACVSWYHLAEFQDSFPDVSVDATALFVADGRCVTCAGGSGAADVASWIVARHVGHVVAKKALHIMQIDAARPGNAPQAAPPIAEGVRDSRIRRAILLIEERQYRPPSIAELAAAAGLSRRQFERRFIAETGDAPAAFASRMRLRYSDWLIRTTDRPMTQIALECGFADAAHFSRRYKSEFGHSPIEARRTSGGFMANERRPYAVARVIAEAG